MFKKIEQILGEFFFCIYSCAGKIASKFLFRAAWGHGSPEWFDHRHHLMNPEKYFTDFWTASADNIIRVLPLYGKLLDLCSGDGFYDYYFYRKRAKEIICVEFNPEAYKQSLRFHRAKNISYLLEDVLKYQPKESYYDVVIIRGAIEHFSSKNQQIIFKKALKALKVGGWFCGDTPANLKTNEKLLSAHEYEWVNEAEMRSELERVFDYVETYSIESEECTTLFWKCKKVK